MVVLTKKESTAWFKCVCGENFGKECEQIIEVGLLLYYTLGVPHLLLSLWKWPSQQVWVSGVSTFSVTLHQVILCKMSRLGGLRGTWILSVYLYSAFLFLNWICLWVSWLLTPEAQRRCSVYNKEMPRGTWMLAGSSSPVQRAASVQQKLTPPLALFPWTRLL